MRKRWELDLYSFYDNSSLEEHLEKMARKGWRLEKLSSGGMIFRRCEPKEIRYTVAYAPGGSNLDPVPCDAQEEFIEMCAYDGWVLVSELDQRMVFCNEDPHAVPMETDPVAKVAGIERAARRGLWANWTVTILLAVSLRLSLGDVRYNRIILLSSAKELTLLLVLTGLLLYFAAELIIWYCWRRKARRMAQEQGEFLQIRGTHVMLKGVAFLGMAGVVYMALAGRNPVLGLVILGCSILYAVTLLLLSGLRRWMQKQGTAWHINLITITVLAVVLLSVWSLGRQQLMHALERPIGQEPPLTAEILTGAKRGTAVTDEINTSGLLTRREYRELGGEGNLSYMQVDVHVQALYDVCRQELLETYADRGDYRPIDEETGESLLHFHVTDPAPWGADEAW